VVSAPDATLTLTLCVVEPLLFVAVRVKVVVLVTLTVVEVPVTAPTPLSTESVVASLTSHCKVTLPPPAGRLEGLAVKLEMVGFVSAGGVGVEGSVQAVRKAIKREILKSKKRFMVVFFSEKIEASSLNHGR
jgi:hypothetical protein